MQSKVHYLLTELGCKVQIKHALPHTAAVCFIQTWAQHEDEKTQWNRSPALLQEHENISFFFIKIDIFKDLESYSQVSVHNTIDCMVGVCVFIMHSIFSTPPFISLIKLLLCFLQVVGHKTQRQLQKAHTHADTIPAVTWQGRFKPPPPPLSSQQQPAHPFTKWMCYILEEGKETYRGGKLIKVRAGLQMCT